MKHKFINRIKSQSFIQTFLSVLVVLIMVARFLRNDYHSVFLCFLTLLLFNIPRIAQKTLKVTIPKVLETIILLFIFSAEILGEIGNFYKHIPGWDSILHTLNGFLMAAIGFALIDVLNRSPKFHVSLSPIFVIFVAFCFSMTIGVLWEFFEYAMDTFAHTDMQKDEKLTEIATFSIKGGRNILEISDIQKTVITTASGETYTIKNGYLDLGLFDTIKDMIVNGIGAIVFSMIGYLYLIGRNKGVFAKKFIPQFKETETSDTDTEPDMNMEN